MREVESYRDLQSAADRVTAVIGERNRQVSDLLTQIDHSSRMVSLNDDMTALIELIQDAVYRKQMAQYEGLLTKFVFAVLKDLGRDVHLTMEIKGSSPHLNVMVDNDGHLEDVWKGNGGALTNILSTGLRLISLYKVVSLGHNIRPFIVFDEVDNWVSAEGSVDFYSNLISLSSSLGLQSIIITHRDVSGFYSLPEVQVLSLSGKPLDDDGVQVKVVSRHDVEFKSEIRSIHLINFRGYVDQVIPLSPSCTIITGKNNIGKSAIIDAIRSASGIDGGDSDVIRHGCQSTSVTFDLGDTHLTWTRNMKKTPVIVYTLTGASGNMIKETPSTAGKAPDWVGARDVLGIKEVDDIDVQLKNQKDGVFMLNLSGPKRASVLTIGSEAKWIDTIQRQWKSGLQWHKTKLKESEKALEETRRILLKLPSGYDRWAQDINETLVNWRKSDVVYSTMSSIGERVDRVKELSGITGSLSIPHMDGSMNAVSYVNVLNSAAAYDATRHKQSVDIPEVSYDAGFKEYGISDIVGVVDMMGKAECAIPESPRGIDVSVYKDTSEHIRSKIVVSKEMDALNSDMHAAESQLQSTISGLDMLKDSWDECPMCGASMHAHADHHSAHARKPKRRKYSEPVQSSIPGM